MKPFDTHAGCYDAWFDSPRGEILFANEIAALRLRWRDTFRPALEVGVGTGRFAQTLGIEQGVDVTEGALVLARRRGVITQFAGVESGPFSGASFRGGALITSLDFVSDAAAVLRKVRRVLVHAGHLLIGKIPRDSIRGQRCQLKKEAGDPFFATMRAFSVEKIVAVLAAEFEPVAFASTLIRSTPDFPQPEEPVPSRIGDAGFVGLLAKHP